MTKVKIFSSHPFQNMLEQQINDFMQSDEFGELIDIKYARNIAGTDGRYKIEVSAMVIYKTK